MNHAIRGLDIGLHDGRVVDFDRVAFHRDREALAVDGLDVAGRDIGGHHLGGDHVVGQDRDQLVLVLGLEKVVESALGQRGERLVGGREDGERPIALEGVDQVGGLDRRDQSRERLVAGGDVDDILLLLLVIAQNAGSVDQCEGSN